jgi:hypothetical protein
MLSCKNILKSEFFVIPLIRFLVARYIRWLSPPWPWFCPSPGCGAGILIEESCKQVVCHNCRVSDTLLVELFPPWSLGFVHPLVVEQIFWLYITYPTIETHNLFTKFLNQNTCSITWGVSDTLFVELSPPWSLGFVHPQVVEQVFWLRNFINKLCHNTLQLWYRTCLQDSSIRIPAPQPRDRHKSRDQGEIIT